MCGIFGILSIQGPPSSATTHRALVSLAHRGPDGEGMWRRDSLQGPFVVFGFRRLAIVDLSDLSAQPMQSVGGNHCMVFNGEIFNYRELRDDLRRLGHSFRSNGDTEVLLTAYRQWGPECVSRLNGMFAFGIWDETDDSFFAARDRFGEKPFFYGLSSDHRTLAFGSELKALFASGVCQPEINDRALLRYVREDVIDGHEEALYSNVFRLLPGRSMTVKVSNGCLNWKIRRYWAPRLSGCGFNCALSPAAKLRELLVESVRLRLQADVPVGTSLSGGIDSSAIVCLIREASPMGDQQTFSARMPDEKLDEGRYIRAVRAAAGVQGHEVIPTADELAKVFSQLCFYMEEPFPATSMFAQFLVMRLAKEHGVTVLLDGQGADELIGGYTGYFRLRYGDLARRLRIGKLLQELRIYSALRDGAKAMSIKRILASYLPGTLLAGFLRKNEERRGFISWWNDEWLVTGNGRGTVLGDGPYLDRFEHRLLEDALNGPLQELLRYGDRNSMAWSRELRQPFLDHNVAEFVCALGPELKIENGTTKYVLREAMRGTVPNVVLDRHDKLGYQAPQGGWLSGQLRSWTEERLEQARYVLGERIGRSVVDRFRRLHHPLNEWREARDVFRLLTLCEGMVQLKKLASSSRHGLLGQGA